MDDKPKKKSVKTRTPLFLPARRALLAILGTALWNLGGPATVQAQLDDFNDGNDDGWTHYDPIAGAGAGPQDLWTFPAGGYRLQAAATPNAAFGPGRVASLRQETNFSGFFLNVDLADWNDTLTQAFGLFARVQPSPSLGTTKGYLFGYVSGAGHYAQIVRVTNERTFSLPGSPPVPLVLVPGNRYRMVFIGTGAQLVGRIYQLPDTMTPLVTVTGMDSNYADGTAGMLAFSLNPAPQAVDATFDNYSAGDVEPPHLNLNSQISGDFILSWALAATGFKLQSSETLPATSWTDLSEDLIVIDDHAGTKTYFGTTGASGNKFFRLFRP